ncbi:hypothetical protein E2C01_016098 [Portunus trituberculatus]|uniref:Uncharacterized protein n=1 Tax=Portunus trituberculatus TaxID=210409 RepID=A0A5B7DN64_PORTR|nr:hypothetical protein [Portunus trituberculatus]
MYTHKAATPVHGSALLTTITTCAASFLPLPTILTTVIGLENVSGTTELHSGSICHVYELQSSRCCSTIPRRDVAACRTLPKDTFDY